MGRVDAPRSPAAICRLDWILRCSPAHERKATVGVPMQCWGCTYKTVSCPVVSVRRWVNRRRAFVPIQEGDPDSSDQKGQDTRMGVLRQSGPSSDGWLSRGSRSDLGSGVPNRACSRSRQAADAVSSDGVIAQCDHGCVKTSEWKTMPENVAGLQTIDWLRLTDRSFAEWALRPPPTPRWSSSWRSPCRRHPERCSFPHAWRLSLSQAAGDWTSGQKAVARPTERRRWASELVRLRTFNGCEQPS
jgi:hypothetical protein